VRCEEVREILVESKPQEIPAPVEEHLSACAGCQEYARSWRLVSAGFEVLTEERVPDASLGFAARLVRRLEEARQGFGSGAEIWERAGRRFVYAALLLTLTMLLALLLPSSGPLRESAAADLYVAQADIASAENDPVLSPETALAPWPGESENGKK